MVLLGLSFWYVVQVERVILCVFLKKDVEVYEELLQVYFPLAAPEGDSRGGELRMSLYCWCGEVSWGCHCTVDALRWAEDVIVLLMQWGELRMSLYCWCGAVCAVDVILFVLLMWWCLCCWCCDVSVCPANTSLGKLPPFCARFCFTYRSTTVPKRLEWTT